MHARLGVIIFGSVRFLFEKVTKKILKLKNSNQNWFKPTGFGSVWLILHKNQKT